MTSHKLAQGGPLDAEDWSQFAPFQGMSQLFKAFQAGMGASRDFEALSRMSDAALADRGLVREEIARKVFATHFGS